MRKEKPRNRPDRRAGSRRRCFLVENWRQAHRWLSVQVAGVLAALQAIYELLPAAKSYVDPRIWQWLMVGGLIAVIVGRLKAQK